VHVDQVLNDLRKINGARRMVLINGPTVSGSSTYYLLEVRKLSAPSDLSSVRVQLLGCELLPPRTNLPGARHGADLAEFCHLCLQVQTLFAYLL
jgi:hypothetical protein